MYVMMYNVMLVMIAGMSRVVGGIGSITIMLATVTERTRESGVRRAMGAKQKDIIVQFLSETMVLSATGGCIGVLLGFSCVWIVPILKWVALDGLPKLGSARTCHHSAPRSRSRCPRRNLGI